LLNLVLLVVIPTNLVYCRLSNSIHIQAKPEMKNIYRKKSDN
jgi:hypothetical protein